MSIAALCCFLPCAGFTDGCAEKQLPPLEQRYQRGILFKIEKCGFPASYILGTIHSASPLIEQAASQAFARLPEVHSAGFEIAQGQGEIAATATKTMAAPQGTPQELIRRLGAARYRRLAGWFKDTGFDFRPDLLAHIRPWALAVMLEMKGLEGGAVLDEKIRNAAMALSKPVFGLETADEQLAIFQHMPEALQWRMLKQAVDEHALVEETVQAMLRAYRAHDGRKLMKLEKENPDSRSDAELDRYLKRKLLTDRNRVMEQRLLPRLKDSVLLSIGAMHLLGEEGVLALLERDGFTITAIP